MLGSSHNIQTILTLEWYNLCIDVYLDVSSQRKSICSLALNYATFKLLSFCPAEEALLYVYV